MNIIKKHPLLSYFVLVFVVMYAAGGLGIWNFLNIPEMLLRVVGSFAPTFVAVFVLGMSQGKQAIKNLFKSFLIWKIQPKWYLATLSLTLISLATTLAYLWYQEIAIPSIVVAEVLGILFLSLFLGPLSEEAGWSGFAFPRLQVKFSPLKASLLLGVLWAVWHAPLWLIPGSPQSEMSFWLFGLVLVALRVIMGWAYNHTRGSLLIAVLFHLFFNYGSFLAIEVLGMPVDGFLYFGGGALVVYAVVVGINSILSRRDN